MNNKWYDERDSRTKLYGLHQGFYPFGEKIKFSIKASPEYVSRYSGQVSAIVLTNLLSRMARQINLDFPDKPIHPRLPWAGQALHGFLLEQMRGANPHGNVTIGKGHAESHILPLGSQGESGTIHGSGWNAYIGPGPSPLPAIEDENPMGPSLAPILAVSQLFQILQPSYKGPKFLEKEFLGNCLNWRNLITPRPSKLPSENYGNIWVAGVGSVGTAVLYFLALSTKRFSPALIDMDKVKRHNLDRSPIFVDSDVGRDKVDAAYDFLTGLGIKNVRPEASPLHKSKIWKNRIPGIPDILVSAANEQNVRYLIETKYPPIQIYGTTGLNMQAAVIRHVPGIDACSFCLFPENQGSLSTVCASAPGAFADEAGQRADVALPFLSFLAGLAAAGEILKTGYKDYPFHPNRVIINTGGGVKFVPAQLTVRKSCVCADRSEKIYAKMLQGTKNANLSPFSSL